MLLVFKYVDGPVGTLLYSWEINNLLKVLCLSKIYGTQGSITFESNGIFVFIRGKSWSLIFPGFSDMTGSKAMLEDFIWALQSGEEPKFNLQLAKRDLVLIETAYKSSGI